MLGDDKMTEYMFDGGLSLEELIAIDCIIEGLPDEARERFIKEYKEEDPEEWEKYSEHRRVMGYSEL